MYLHVGAGWELSARGPCPLPAGHIAESPSPLGLSLTGRGDSQLLACDWTLTLVPFLHRLFPPFLHRSPMEHLLCHVPCVALGIGTCCEAALSCVLETVGLDQDVSGDCKLLLQQMEIPRILLRDRELPCGTAFKASVLVERIPVASLSPTPPAPLHSAPFLQSLTTSVTLGRWGLQELEDSVVF